MGTSKFSFLALTSILFTCSKTIPKLVVFLITVMVSIALTIFDLSFGQSLVSLISLVWAVLAWPVERCSNSYLKLPNYGGHTNGSLDGCVRFNNIFVALFLIFINVWVGLYIIILLFETQMEAYSIENAAHMKLIAPLYNLTLLLIDVIMTLRRDIFGLKI